jgi:hypothetical protein
VIGVQIQRRRESDGEVRSREKGEVFQKVIEDVRDRTQVQGQQNEPGLLENSPTNNVGTAAPSAKKPRTCQCFSNRFTANREPPNYHLTNQACDDSQVARMIR